MKKIILTVLVFLPLTAFADAFVPEFNKMKNLRCDFEETIYTQEGSQISKSKQFRIFKLDEENQKIYLQKEPIDRIIYYGNDRIEFNLQTMTDETITMSNTVIDKNKMEYRSNSEITYDDIIFGTRKANAVGTCKFLD